MIVKETAFEGLFELEPNVYKDHRGYFIESFNQHEFDKIISNITFVQDNESQSSYGVLRGLHFQNKPREQSKLVRVVQGEVLDVVVDLRLDSTTFGQHLTFILNDTNKKQVFIPKGFAHGYVVLSETATFLYKVDEYYDPKNDSGIHWNDSTLSIDWKIDKDDIIVSEKDKGLMTFKKYIEING